MSKYFDLKLDYNRWFETGNFEYKSLSFSQISIKSYL